MDVLDVRGRNPTYFVPMHVNFWRFTLLRRRGHPRAAAQTDYMRRATQTCYSTVQYGNPRGRSECKQVFLVDCDGEGKFSVSSSILIQMWVPVPVPGPLLYGLLPYILLLDNHHAMHMFSLQVMCSVKRIYMLLQLCCVAAVFRDNVCLTTTHNRPTHMNGYLYHLVNGCCMKTPFWQEDHISKLSAD